MNLRTIFKPASRAPAVAGLARCAPRKAHTLENSSQIHLFIRLIVVALAIVRAVGEADWGADVGVEFADFTL